MRQKIFIYQETPKERLDKFIQDQLSVVSRHQIKKAILHGQVLVNSQKPSVHHWLKRGDKITWQSESSDNSGYSGSPITPRIIDQTEEYVVINKPYGLLVHPTEAGEKNTLAGWLKERYPQIKKVGENPQRPGLVHRLDREASGLMVMALTPKSFVDLKNQFQNREVRKEYIALVHGAMINDRGEIKSSLERDRQTGHMKAQTAKNSGQEAHTIYEVIKKFQNYTLLKVNIKTGRSHQIRVHLYSIGHSLVGDRIYQTKDIRKKKKVRPERLFLHASLLEFKDLGGQKKIYRSRLPKALEDLLKIIK